MVLCNSTLGGCLAPCGDPTGALCCIGGQVLGSSDTCPFSSVPEEDRKAIEAYIKSLKDEIREKDDHIIDLDTENTALRMRLDELEGG